MGQRCAVCGHKKRLEIDKEIISGGNLTELAKRYGINYNTMYFHAKNHISRQLLTYENQQKLIQNTDLLQKIDNIITKTEDIFRRNYEKKKDIVALKALSTQKGVLELLAKISFEIHASRQLDIQTTNEEAEEQKQTEFAESIKVLTMSELLMLEHLQKKIETQDKNFIIIPDKEDIQLKLKRKLKNKVDMSVLDENLKESNTNVLNNASKLNEQTDEMNNMRVKKIKSTEIPHGDWRDIPDNIRVSNN